VQELLLIRADANSEIGVGHVMRCLGLAQNWQKREGQVLFILNESNPAIQQRLAQENIKTLVLNLPSGSPEDAVQTARLIQQYQAKAILVDGYQFKEKWFQIIKKTSAKIALWTDFPQDNFLPVDLILNQNPHAQAAEYKKLSPQARILNGLNYLVLREEFLNNHRARKKREQGVKKILITMGGGDYSNDTLKILNALACLKLTDLEISVIVGYNNKNKEEIIQEAKHHPSIQVISPQQDFASFTFDYDLAITGAGATLWELAYLGLPSLGLVVAENQVPLARLADQLGISINLGWNKDFTADNFNTHLKNLIDRPDLLKEMSQKGLDLIDGQGVIRVSDEIKKLIK